MGDLPKVPKSSQDWLIFLAIRHRHTTAAAVNAAAAAVALLLEEEEQQAQNSKKKKTKHRRAPRRYFDAYSAYDDVYKDYLRVDKPTWGAAFSMIYRLSRTRVQILLEDFGRLSETNPFFKTFRCDKFGRVGSCLEVKILLPLRVMAYGKPPHDHCDYFKVSFPQAREIVKQFVFAIAHLYKDQYLYLPNAQDVSDIVTLHERQHHVPGMLGSLDCMMTKWKNCPVAWQQSFKGRSKGMCTITLEAACDYNLWFWHAAYGYSGALNDANILGLSPLLERMTNGSLSRIEQQAGVAPFLIPGTQEPFYSTYFLVDGIYPRYSRLLKAVKHPFFEDEKKFSEWQEGARKDIERAFGVLQCRWKCMCSPFYYMDQQCIYQMVTSCLIFHNMCVQERIMGNCTDRYDASTETDVAEQPHHIIDHPDEVMIRDALRPLQVVRDDEEGLDDEGLALAVIRHHEWVDLDDEDEHFRLQRAMMLYKGGPRPH